MEQHKIVWFEVLGRDAQNLQGFYGELFGWKFSAGPPDYSTVDPNTSGIPGGVGKADQGEGWTTFYVGVSDIERSLERVKELGGKPLTPVIDLPDVRIAMFADPEGHPMGLAESRN